jgi:hypothetical protein
LHKAPETEETVSSKYISDVFSIGMPPLYPIDIIEDVAKCVERPLIKACEIFFSKNIQTTESSANKHNVAHGKAYIFLDADSLSDENREIAEAIGFRRRHPHGYYIYEIYFDIDDETSVEELSAAAIAVAEQFKPQPWRWVKPFDIEKARGKFAQGFLTEGEVEFERSNIEMHDRMSEISTMESFFTEGSVELEQFNQKVRDQMSVFRDRLADLGVINDATLQSIDVAVGNITDADIEEFMQDGIVSIGRHDPHSIEDIIKMRAIILSMPPAQLAAHFGIYYSEDEDLFYDSELVYQKYHGLI